MIDLEAKELDDADHALLRAWHIQWEVSSEKAREVVLVGRLQRALGVYVVDGMYGPHTHDALRRQELPLGPELSRIVQTYARRKHFP